MNKIKEFRVSKRLTQEAMARQMNVTLAGYSQVERGVRPAGRAFIDKMKTAFPEISIEDMFFTKEV